jgi:hypothetical protein
MILSSTSNQLFYTLHKLNQPHYADIITWNRFIESHFDEFPWLHDKRTRIAVGYYADSPNTYVEHVFSEAQVRYVPDTHTKLILLRRKGLSIPTTYVGSLNLENGKLTNLLVQIKDRETIDGLVKLFNRTWRKAKHEIEPEK